MIDVMREIREKEIAEKMQVLAALETTLMRDSRSEVKSIEYFHDEQTDQEAVCVSFFGNHEAWINTTHNSSGANILAVISEVYGGRASGRLYYIPAWVERQFELVKDLEESNV